MPESSVERFCFVSDSYFLYFTSRNTNTYHFYDFRSFGRAHDSPNQLFSIVQTPNDSNELEKVQNTVLNILAWELSKAEYAKVVEIVRSEDFGNL